jgi:hypothetical protein
VTAPVGVAKPSGPANVAGLDAIVDHRRHDQAIFQREASNREWLEKPWLCRFAAIGSVTHWRISLNERSTFGM